MSNVNMTIGRQKPNQPLISMKFREISRKLAIKIMAQDTGFLS